MPRLDEFESQFRRASKASFVFEKAQIARICLVIDADELAVELYKRALTAFFCGMYANQKEVKIDWCVLTPTWSKSVPDLINLIEDQKPDLIITRRHLFKDPGDRCESLGIYVDVLAQSTEAPLLLLPQLSPGDLVEKMANTNEVMVISEDLSRDSHLINIGCHFTSPEGRLYLIDIEDGVAFKRFLGVIEKVPGIDATVVKQEVESQIRKEVGEYSEQIIKSFNQQGLKIEVASMLRFGSNIQDFRKLLEEHSIDLIVLNTKDESQMAMHSLAYPVAVEFTHYPILLL